MGHIAIAIQPAIDTRQGVDIEALLRWTFARQRAHVVIGRVAAEAGGYLAGGGVDSIERCRRLAETGGRVDGGGPSANHLHPDADTVFAAVGRHCRVAELVTRCATTLDRPDWMPGAVPRLGPVLDERGRPVLAYPAGDAHRNYGWCRIHEVVSAAQIARARDAYAAWHADLVRLAALPDLRRLALWRVTGPGVPSRPWVAYRA